MRAPPPPPAGQAVGSCDGRRWVAAERERMHLRGEKECERKKNRDACKPWMTQVNEFYELI